jgi:hypothetical protein
MPGCGDGVSESRNRGSGLAPGNPLEPEVIPLGGGVADPCASFAAKVFECGVDYADDYGGDYGDYGGPASAIEYVEDCQDYIRLAGNYAGPECATAFAESFACLSSLSCDAFRDERGCRGEERAAELACARLFGDDE